MENRIMYQVPSSSVLIRRKQVEALTSLSRSRIYALINEGTFPKPVRLGAQSVAWSLAEIEAWVSQRIAASKETDPVS